ncbi:hypothetical protein [Bosea sp. NBC_00550]|jgi:hypothetical protein|uniref:hypothetical protein n=1 Tax=Bosea sp. NBC_00550 TaxID=2969621 RepID=UPI002231EE48|nr:hypothetical protein [Bosea sp. NBC_00550]UZF92638.1 hypothetical protein NWE53_26950 [Bosea sp. NBC_00550]
MNLRFEISFRFELCDILSDASGPRHKTLAQVIPSSLSQKPQSTLFSRVFRLSLVQRVGLASDIG